jgi:hypothetical protein
MDVPFEEYLQLKRIAMICLSVSLHCTYYQQESYYEGFTESVIHLDNWRVNEYQIYIYRFWQAMCRVICSQEIMHAMDNSVKYCELKKRLKTICTHSLTVEALKVYPISKLPLKQKVFAYGIRYKLYFLLKILVMLRR